MSSQLRRLWALSNVIALTFVVAACSSPTSPSIEPTVAAAALTPTAAPNQTKQWPVPHPDGQYGHEDPNYPPEPWMCPREYDVVYNGWNFVCVAPYCCYREFPRTSGYPDDWKP